MDTEAEHTERDRPGETPAPAGCGDTTPQPPGAGEARGSRSASVSGADDGARERAGLVARLPGGRLTVGFLLGLVLLFLAHLFVVEPFRIPSDSMEPAHRSGDRVLVNKVAYRFGAEPERGDVVVFDGSGLFGDGDYIKRVVGVGGDHVTCCDVRGRIAVNGRSVDEPYLHRGEKPSTVRFDVVVPEGTLFVLGDHRGASSDSRDHLGSPGGGMIPVEQVVGRADWTVWPPSRWTSHERPATFDGIPAAGGAHG